MISCQSNWSLLVDHIYIRQALSLSLSIFLTPDVHLLYIPFQRPICGQEILSTLVSKCASAQPDTKLVSIRPRDKFSPILIGIMCPRRSIKTAEGACCISYADRPRFSLSEKKITIRQSFLTSTSASSSKAPSNCSTNSCGLPL